VWNAFVVAWPARLRSRLKEPPVPLTPPHFFPPALEIVCDGAPGRLNEDAWLVMQSGTWASAC
jgi:hypothetical protein